MPAQKFFYFSCHVPAETGKVGGLSIEAPAAGKGALVSSISHHGSSFNEIGFAITPAIDTTMIPLDQLDIVPSFAVVPTDLIVVQGMTSEFLADVRDPRFFILHTVGSFQSPHPTGVYNLGFVSIPSGGVMTILKTQADSSLSMSIAIEEL